MEFAGFNLPSNLLETLDEDVLEFYYYVLSKELDLGNKPTISRLKLELTSLNDSLVLRWKEVQYNSVLKRCGFLLKHAACLSSVVAHNFFKLLKKNPFILLKAMNKRQFNICCLGGGPGTVVVALSKIISVMQTHFWVRTGEALEFSVTVVDKDANWEAMSKYILRTLEKTPHLFDSEKMNLNFKFFQANIFEPLDKEMLEIVENADMISMVYLIPDINGKIATKICAENAKLKQMKRKRKGCITNEIMKDRVKKEIEVYSKAMQEIFERIKVGTLIFFMDSTSNSSYRIMSDSVQKFEDFNKVYGPQVQEVHFMSLHAAKKYFELWNDNFWSLTRTMYFSDLSYNMGAWVKINRKHKDVNLMWSEAIQCEKNENNGGRQLTVSSKIESNVLTIDKKIRRKNIKKILTYRRKVKQFWLHLSGMDKFASPEENEVQRTYIYEQDFLDNNGRPLFLTKCKRRRLFSKPSF